MAAPASKTLRKLDGKWSINKTLSDDTDPVLTLQSIGWLTRKALSLGTVTQILTSYLDPSGNTHMDVQQTITGGLSGTTEKRTMDWQYRPHSDWLFGDVRGRSRFTALSDLVAESKAESAKPYEAEDAAFLAEGWREETAEGEVVESWVENEGKGWSAWQVWGFADVEGERWFVRRFVVRKTKEGVDEKVRVRLVYGWVGELDEEE